MKVVRYAPEYKDQWNSFLNKSKNATFLFHRNFLSYHEDKFIDHSLIALDNKNKIIGILPANIANNNTLISHQGLTYGAFSVKADARLLTVLEVIYSMLKFLFENEIFHLRLKQFPFFYTRASAMEIEYVLFFIECFYLSQRCSFGN